MKRILVVDESRLVRETLALILGQDFMVIQRSFISDEDPFSIQERIGSFGEGKVQVRIGFLKA